MTTEPRFALPDVNVLVALTNPSHVFHGDAHTWLEGVAAPVATTPVTESGLLRMLLNRAVTGQEVTPRQAIAIVEDIRSDSRTTFLPDDSSLAAAAVDLTGLAGHKQVTDWHLLNLARQHGGVLVTFDRRLSRSVTTIDATGVLLLGGPTP